MQRADLHLLAACTTPEHQHETRRGAEARDRRSSARAAAPYLTPGRGRMPNMRSTATWLWPPPMSTTSRTRGGAAPPPPCMIDCAGGPVRALRSARAARWRSDLSFFHILAGHPQQPAHASGSANRDDARADWPEGHTCARKRTGTASKPSCGRQARGLVVSAPAAQSPWRVGQAAENAERR